MSSTVSSSSGFFSSPRNQQKLLWLSGAVLVIGIAVFLAVFFSRGNSQPSVAASHHTVKISTPSGGSSGLHTTPPAGQVKAAPAALRVARTFVETAVLRKNLDTAYDIVGPNLKGGISRAVWRTGNIPATYYPAINAKTTAFLVNSSHPKSVLLEFVLKARKGSGIKPLAFQLRVDRLGGKWLVNYFLPEPNMKVQANPYSN